MTTRPGEAAIHPDADAPLEGDVRVERRAARSRWSSDTFVVVRFEQGRWIVKATRYSRAAAKDEAKKWKTGAT